MDAHGLLDAVVDLFFPKRCAGCGAAGGWLCPDCRADLVALPAARCPRCGAPLGRQAQGNVVGCRECRGRELAFTSACAAFVYEGSARALVTACKFRALRSIAGEMAELAAPAFAAAVEGTQADCVACVPGHRGRSLERGFNQAELLARALAASVGLRHEPLLVRVREGARQSGMDRAARAANVRGLYALNTGADRVLDGIERVVIVDDVYTTGETLNHCAGVLADRGVETRVFTFARAVRRSRPRLRTPSPSAGMPAEASQPQP